MAGLVPAIHVLKEGKSWMPGSAEPVIGPRVARTRWRFCPDMTVNGIPAPQSDDELAQWH